MTGKAEFTQEEWQGVLEGPPSAAMIIVTAQRRGSFRETIAMAQAYAEARQLETAVAVHQWPAVVTTLTGARSGSRSYNPAPPTCVPDATAGDGGPPRDRSA
jgi:hypothetical protein